MADFSPLPGDPPAVQTHNAVAIAAGGSNAKTVAFRKAVRQLTVFWKVTGLGVPRLRLFARDLAGNNLQLGADQTATSGRLELPTGTVVAEVKVEFAETGVINSITATAEVCSAP